MIRNLLLLSTFIHFRFNIKNIVFPCLASECKKGSLNLTRTPFSKWYDTMAIIFPITKHIFVVVVIFL